MTLFHFSQANEHDPDILPGGEVFLVNDGDRPGWYWRHVYVTEYSAEGPFASEAEAIAHARS